jgi:hypothetical protein
VQRLCRSLVTNWWRKGRRKGDFGSLLEKDEILVHLTYREAYRGATDGVGLTVCGISQAGGGSPGRRYPQLRAIRSISAGERAILRLCCVVAISRSRAAFCERVACICASIRAFSADSLMVVAIRAAQRKTTIHSTVIDAIVLRVCLAANRSCCRESCRVIDRVLHLYPSRGGTVDPGCERAYSFAMRVRSNHSSRRSVSARRMGSI